MTNATLKLQNLKNYQGNNLKNFLYYLKYTGLNTRMSTNLQHTSQQVKYNKASWQELTPKNRIKKSSAKQSIGCV